MNQYGYTVHLGYNELSRDREIRFVITEVRYNRGWMFSDFHVIELKYKILADIGLHFWAYFDTFLDFRQNFDVFC